MRELKPLQLSEVDEEDLRWLRRALEEDGKSTLEDLSREMQSGSGVLWRFMSDEGRGVLFTIEQPEYIVVWLVAGKGLAPNMQYIQDCLDEFTRLRGKTEIVAVMNKPSMARLVSRVGYKTKEYVYSKGV